MYQKVRTNSFEELPASFGVNYLAGYLDISIENAYKLVAEKDFPCMKLGRKYVINKEYFKKWLDKKYGFAFK